MAHSLLNVQSDIEQVPGHVDALRWGDSSVVVYPAWFYGAPALLLRACGVNFPPCLWA